MAAIGRISKTQNTSTVFDSKTAMSKSRFRGREYEVITEPQNRPSGLLKIISNHPIFHTSEPITKERVFEFLHSLQKTSEGQKEKRFIKNIFEEIKAISQVPYERHKLQPLEMLKICIVASLTLKKAIEESTLIYLKAKKYGLDRAVVVDGFRRTFTILSKDHGELNAAGTFKKVTDAVDVLVREHVTATRVVCLRNKKNRVLSKREIAYQNMYGNILSWLEHRSSKDRDVKKTTIIEEAFDHDLYPFTGYISEDARKKLSLPELVSVVSEIGNTIERMHEDDIVHHDLKVKNVLYRKNADGTIQAKVTDFGHTYHPSRGKLTSPTSNHRYGTVRYSAPELLDPSTQLSSLLQQRKAEDMYALGCIIYEVLFQKPLPWNDDVYAALKEKSDRKMHITNGLRLQKQGAEELLKSSSKSPLTEQRELEWICARLLDPNPKTRFKIAEFQTAIANLQSKI